MNNRFNEFQFASYAAARRNGFAQALWNTKGAAIALAFLAMLLPACSTKTAEQVGGPTAKTNVTTEEVADKTNALNLYFQQTIKLLDSKCTEYFLVWS